MREKGFTLIELLVVIAIIGILSSMVLVSVNTARNRGKDATIIGSLSNMRSAAELYNDASSTYSGFCGSPDATKFSEGIKKNYPSAEASKRYTCKDDEKAWAACAHLLATTSAWCVDASGASRSILPTTCDPTSWSATTCPSQ